MKGLCHHCLSSNVELVIKAGQILCNTCANPDPGPQITENKSF